MTEFKFGDRVKWSHTDLEGWVSYGTVVDERNRQAEPVMGDFDECLPQPVAVLWDEPGEVWWTPGHEIELA